MTLSILDIEMSENEMKRRALKKVLINYMAVTLLCGSFSMIYEYFSHGVYSNYMVYLFLFPFLGGLIPYSLLVYNKGSVLPGRLSANLHHLGIATLAVGSCIKGILDIYGTTSPYIPVYWVAGGVMIFSGILNYVYQNKK